MQNVVREICDLWRTETGANIQFRFRRIVDKKTPIRIGFSANNGSWSYIGTTALAFGFDENQPTMALAIADDTPVEAMRRVILHEFGHALGLGHEHQNPAFSMTWNDQAVRNDLMMQGWNEAMIEANVLHPLRHGETTFTEFDPHSIMLYPIPAHWTQEGQATAWNTTLSERDKKFAHDFLCPPSHGVR
jgi:serralysin